MKKNSTCQSPKREGKRKDDRITIGLDLGDKTNRYCVLDGEGEVIKEGSVATTKKAMLEELLRQIHGVGPLIALTFVLTVEDRERFEKSRDGGCYVGLRPKRSESGEREPQLGISKYLRKLLVQGAHCVLSRRGEDSDLKRWGLKLANRGGKNAKKRAVVAVARKLAILLHRLWVTGEVYEPLRNSRAVQVNKAAA